MFAAFLNVLRPAARQPSSQWMAVVICWLGISAITAGAARADTAAQAPSPSTATTPLTKATAQLVAEALQANQGLLAERAVVARRFAELDRARARYLPSLDFQARYTRADGGRTIEFPLGDLLNPVYAALDAQLVAQGRPPQFPRVANQEFNFVAGSYPRL